MARHGIPTARFASFTDRASAHAYVDQQGAPIVIKADGLAAGKGVVGGDDSREAHAALDRMLPENGACAPEGGTPTQVVVEEFLEGEEASFIVLVDGKDVLPLASSQDHKAYSATAIPAPTPAHGRLLASAGGDPRCTPDDGANSSCRRVGEWPPRESPTPFPSTPG